MQPALEQTPRQNPQPGGELTPPATPTKTVSQIEQFALQGATSGITQGSLELIGAGAGLATPKASEVKLTWKFTELILSPIARFFLKWGLL